MAFLQTEPHTDKCVSVGWGMTLTQLVLLRLSVSSHLWIGVVTMSDSLIVQRTADKRTRGGGVKQSSGTQTLKEQRLHVLAMSLDHADLNKDLCAPGSKLLSDFHPTCMLLP